MSDFQTEDEQNQPSGKDLRSQLEASLREAREAKAEADRLRREVAFSKVGVDDSNKLHQLFVKNYDGELTPEAVAASFTEYFGEAQQTQQSTTSPDARSWAQMDDASFNAAPGDVAGTDEAAIAKLTDPSQFKSLAEYAQAAKAAGLGKNLLNG